MSAKTGLFFWCSSIILMPSSDHHYAIYWTRCCRTLQKRCQNSRDKWSQDNTSNSRKCFEESASHELPPISQVGFMPLISNLKPSLRTTAMIYPLSPVKQTALNAFLDGMTASWLYSTLNFPTSLSLLLCQKKDVKLHLCARLLSINSLMIKNQYLPSHFRCHRQTQGCEYSPNVSIGGYNKHS